ncbi:DNA-formamidopyrimidine glycosylase [Bacillaceae bacterium SIJ1]|uniref:DNA-formamidopyrimidine glycosylase n=1 Tax=Litoribacterium kuwaitense TaxID=1398745 RepID=UPI0013EB9932|nr:DNA-formamidopyrimidine glycosylase [Litoribacterium kuwaitense]NGP45020.1 DNA-formamidopyrimidine glycosylase [Litoribacterium kuwaitense]
MPELPEVESVRRALERLICGKVIERVDVFWPKILKRPDDQALWTPMLSGASFQSVSRVGKCLILYTEQLALVSHLRMEGKYELASSAEGRDKHTHVVFVFNDGTELRYNDVRKFGTMHLYEKGEEHLEKPLNQIGQEPIDPAFDIEKFAHAVGRTKRVIKAVLLDQTIVAGLGNIYVDETLHRALLHPSTPADQLTRDEIERITVEMKQVLHQAIEKGGTTIRSYHNAHGDEGLFQNHLLVYGRVSEACQMCGTPIEKTVVAGRGTHYCIECQPQKH